MLCAAASMMMLVLGGCATQAVDENAPPPARPVRGAPVTGSRIPIYDTISAIGLKTIDQDELFRLTRNNPGSNK